MFVVVFLPVSFDSTADVTVDDVVNVVVTDVTETAPVSTFCCVLPTKDDDVLNAAVFWLVGTGLVVPPIMLKDTGLYVRTLLTPENQA